MAGRRARCVGVPEIWTVRLHFESRVQFGGAARGAPLPSDRLYSTLCWGVHECWGAGAVDEYSAACLRGTPPWLVSSAFPFVDGTAYVPKPLLPLPQAWIPHARSLKSTQWIPLEAFRDWIAGDAADGDSLVQASARVRTALTEDIQPHVALDRTNADPQLYHTDGLAFRPGSGLYFFVRVEDDAWSEFVRGALRVLADAGVGARRSAGLGHFRAEVLSAPPECRNWGAAPPGAWCLLSRLSPHPESAGALLAGATFGVTEVGGWVSDAQVRRRRVRLLTEGSVFRQWDPGRWVPVHPPGWDGHPVYRGGFSFPVPLSEGVLA